MQGGDRGLVLLVPVLWGLNFPATALMLDHYPPFLAATLRFVLMAIPAILFVPFPQVRLRWLIGTGLGLGVMQFSFLYLGMATGMPAGLASLVLQASAPFTILLAAAFLGERLTPLRLAGIGLAVLGLTIIGTARAQSAALLPMMLTLLAALGWAVGNICSRLARAPKPLHLTMWMSIVPPIPLFLLSLLMEGPRIVPALGGAFTTAAMPANLGLLYIIVFATVLGYGIWNTLMSRYPASEVAPWSMLVPIVGFSSAWVMLGERPRLLELAAGALVIAGVVLASRTAA
ncbi:EamA family transporter [Paracoccus sp. MC1862]|uniref:EamA family transporter n=1 Tax=Paracoccus sp. MC1862 TaxID=2760307 RepID=UPI001603972A|nr:EamA family transporter [Paracoccus sp. MC1862]MBB1498328.1 EamA family transporter [Paracoccus sp. MC1862]QQO44916.1 EamA family transporter [Paracoccus sp. MC1862]